VNARVQRNSAASFQTAHCRRDLEWLLADFPALGGHHDGVAFAVNQEYVTEDFRPRNDDEVASFRQSAAASMPTEDWAGVDRSRAGGY